MGLALALLAMSVGNAAAVRKPDRVPVELPDSIDFAAGEVCDFAVHLVFSTNREYLTTWYDAQGNPVRDNYTGTLTIRITNMDANPPISADLNIGGPGGDTYAADGSSLDDFHGHGFPLRLRQRGQPNPAVCPRAIRGCLRPGRWLIHCPGSWRRSGGRRPVRRSGDSVVMEEARAVIRSAINRVLRRLRPGTALVFLTD
jgi:hypothetical protein